MRGMINDLYAYNDWANGKVLTLCEGLTDEQLDLPREMGFGTLRATLFHILTAEVVWLERWKSVPWRTFPTDPEGMSLEDIAGGLRKVATDRQALIDNQQHDRWQKQIQYQDSQQTPYDHRLFDLLLHVANHAVHHRAQALNYLKQFDRTVVAGIDYCFYRLAKHAVPQTPEAIEGLTGFGLEVADSPGDAVAWDHELVARYYGYNDWGTGKVLEFAKDLNDDALDRDFQMGPGSIRKTLLHLFDAERWWTSNWTTGPGTFPHSPSETTISQLAAEWPDVSKQRATYIESIDADESQRVIEVLAGGPPTRFRVGETAVHVATHGTHHRAQLINMFRHVGAPWTNIDLLYAIGDF